MQIKAIGVGDNVVDKYVNVGVMYPGGQAMNFASYAKQQGADSAYLGVFGTDEAAEHVKSVANELGIRMERIRTVEGENGYACVTLIDGDRKFLYSNKGGVAKTNPPVLDEEDLAYLKGFDVMFTDDNSHIDPELPKLKGTGVPLTYDFSVRSAPEALERVCPYIDFAVASCSHISLEEMEERMKLAHSLGCKYVIATRGAEGSFVYNGKELFKQEAKFVEAKDTMGAGDAFTTAFLLNFISWKKGQKPELPDESAAIKAAMDAAAAFSAKVCLVDGAFGHGKQIEITEG